MEQMVEAIANRYLDINCTCFTPNDGRMERIVTSPGKEGGQGNQLHPGFCDPTWWEANRVTNDTQRSTIPLLNPGNRLRAGRYSQIKTRLKLSLEMLGNR